MLLQSNLKSIIDLSSDEAEGNMKQSEEQLQPKMLAKFTR